MRGAGRDMSGPTMLNFCSVYVRGVRASSAERAGYNGVMTSDASRMYDIEGGREVVRGDYFALWRAGELGWFKVWGEVDDERSDHWRGVVEQALNDEGMPRFLGAHIADAVPLNSLATRVRTAGFVRRLGRASEHALIYNGKNVQMSFTFRSVLRVAGISNVSFADEEPVFLAALRLMATGELPRIAGVRGPTMD